MVDEVSIWTALADPKRRQIITLLEEKPRTTIELSSYFDVSRYAVMKHLKVLEGANLITSIRQGRVRWNYLNEDLAHFLRTKLAEEDGPNRLVDILGLFPGKRPASTIGDLAPIPAKIEQRLLLQATPSQVFEAFTIGIDCWWSWRTSSTSEIYLEPYLDGRFFEAFNAAGHGILFANITYIKQDEELHLKGTSELTEYMANVSITDNNIRVTFETQQNDTLLCLSHTFLGTVDGTVTEIIRHCWRHLLDQHFQPFVEKGIPYQHNP